MIPYEDLVVALNNWRAKQGLPVAAAVLQMPAPGSGGIAAAPVAAAAPQPEAYEAAEDSLEVGDDLVEEAAHYDGGYGVETASDDATSIGRPPQRGDYDENPTELASESGQLRKRDDW